MMRYVITKTTWIIFTFKFTSTCKKKKVWRGSKAIKKQY